MSPSGGIWRTEQGPPRPTLSGRPEMPILIASESEVSRNTRLSQGPHRLEAQDTALSRRRQGFESPWGYWSYANSSAPSQLSIAGGFFVAPATGGPHRPYFWKTTRIRQLVRSSLLY